MLTKYAALDRAQSLVANAMKAGADAADAVYVCDGSTDVQVRLGRLEEVSRSEGEEIGLRVFAGRKSATISSSSMNPEILAGLVTRALDMAREAPDDPYAGLAPQDMLMTGDFPDIDSDDGEDPGPAILQQRALACEDAARAVAGITGSEGAGATAGRSVFALATSHGFAAANTASGYSIYASLLAGQGDAKERDYAYRTLRHESDLPDPADLGKLAAARTVGRLNPVTVKSGPMPILFDPRVGGSLIGHLLSAISGSAVARRTSFLLDALNQQLFDSSIMIIDDPLRPRGLSSRAFDGEGLPTRASAIIDKGMLTGWMMDSASARQLGLAPTGHAARGTSGAPGVSAANVHLEGGDITPQQLMDDVKNGIYITELSGQGVNPITGDYSRGASGYLIENGAVTSAVSEFTIAGNLKDMFRHMQAANDLEFIRSVNVPTLRVDGMMVAGA